MFDNKILDAGDSNADAPEYRVARAEGWRPLHVVILFLYGAFLTWPALSTGYIPSRDTLIHLLWSTNFSNQLWAGEVYPRWLDQMNGGLGSPVFFFYPPLPYYLTALLKPLFHADPEGWHQIGVAASMAVILSGFSAYFWLRRVAGASAALIAAIIYMSAPYHLAIDLYDRFAFAELWSFVWLPLIIWSIHLAVAGNRKALLGLPLAYAALVLTHLPTAMIFSPVALAYAFLNADRGSRVRGVMVVSVAMALGTGLAAEFLIPVLTTQQNISLSDMRVGRLSYIYNFLYYGLRFNSDFTEMLTQQGWYAGIMMSVSLSAFFLGGRIFPMLAMHLARFWILIAILAFAMMLPVTRPIWDLLPPLQAIQFPWRFNVLLTLAMVALIALWAGAIKPGASRLNGFVLAVACMAVIGHSLFVLPTYLALASSSGEPSMAKMLAQFGTINDEAKEKVLAAGLAIDVAEYRPKWVPHTFNSSTQALRASLDQMQADLLERGQGRAFIQSRSPRHMVVAVDIPVAGWVKLPHFYYPGWRATVGDPVTQLPIRPSIPEGLIEVKIEPGRHEIVLELMTSMAEKIGWAISGFSVFVFGWFAFRLFRRQGEQSRIV